MAKLLILSSDTGEGHNSAARALEETAVASGLTASVRKPLEESGRLNRTLGALYNAILTRCPHRMGNYFWLVDRCRPNERDFLYSKAKRFIGGFLDSEQPDMVLSVHPMLNHFIQRFIKEENLGVPCHTLLTDPFPPFWQGWASPWVDRFFVPTSEALQELTAMGVAAWRIEKVPMPVRQQFRPFSEQERDSLREELNLDESTTILLNGGARGGGPLQTIYHAVRKAAPDANILIVCGRNQSLQERIEAQAHPRTHTFGFVADIHRFIAGSDLVLTKPGALSTYETLACGVPVLLLGLKGLMPQESGLFRAAKHYEFAFAASRLSEIEDIVHQGAQTWHRLRSSLGAFYKISSGEEIVTRLLHEPVSV